MKSVPRILPLVGVAIGGVLAVNALTGARDLPSLVSGAQAFAEEAVKTVAPGKADVPASKSEVAEKVEGRTQRLPCLRRQIRPRPFVRPPPPNWPNRPVFHLQSCRCCKALARVADSWTSARTTYRPSWR